VEVETATHRLSEVMKKDPDFYHVPGWFEYVSELGASLLVQATGMVFRDYKKESTADGNKGPQHNAPSSRRPLLTLEYLVSTLTIFGGSQSPWTADYIESPRGGGVLQAEFDEVLADVLIGLVVMHGIQLTLCECSQS